MNPRASIATTLLLPDVKDIQADLTKLGNVISGLNLPGQAGSAKANATNLTKSLCEVQDTIKLLH